MKAYIDLERTLPTEQQAIVNALNAFLSLLPEDQHSEEALRMAMVILEAADVAPQAELAQILGFSQTRSVRVYKQRLQATLADLLVIFLPRSVRVYKQRLQEQGLSGLWERLIPGRPAVSTQVVVERAVIEAILSGVIQERILPGDDELAETVKRIPNGSQVTASMVETIRLRWGIQRQTLTQQLRSARPAATAETAQVRLGQTRVGGTFLLAILLVESGWLRLAQLLPMAAGYAVTATQWLLTAFFSVIFGVRRAFHLNDVCDIGFALVTGRPRPLSHSTFQHVLWSIPVQAVLAFYAATAQPIARSTGAGTRRISLDGHNLPRYTRLDDLTKGKIGSTGRVLKAEELVLAYDLDAHLWLALRTYQGTKKLTQGLVSIIDELQTYRQSLAGWLRVFFDKGGYQGLIFQQLLNRPGVYFYTPAVRYKDSVAQWERLTETDFEAEPFVFDKHADLPKHQRPSYRLADTHMTINVREKGKVVGTVTLRAIVLCHPQGKKPAERWPFVLLTNDEQSEAQALLNEFGDHWGQEFGHRIGKHDLYLDILPAGYLLSTRRDDQGQLQREVKYDEAAFFLSAWLRCLVFNLMSRFAQELGGTHTKMWAGTLLRKFIRRPATLYLVGKELHVVFDPFPGQEDLLPLLERLNAKRTAIPWLNNLVVQFSIAQNVPLHPLAEPEKRNRLFGDG